MVKKQSLQLFSRMAAGCDRCQTRVSAAVLAGFLLFSQHVFGAETVAVENMVFASQQDYLQSDFFRSSGRRCGTVAAVGVMHDERLARSAAHCTRLLTSLQQEYWPDVVYVIPVWWHVLYHSSGSGNIGDSAIEAQMAVLNEDFRAAEGTMGSSGFDVRIQFELAGITRTQNDTWYNDQDESVYKQTLGKDQERYLNIYVNNTSYLGYAYFPQDYAGNWRDGVVVTWQSVGGRNNGNYPYDQGRTLVHEVGHYLGLYHTFEDGGSCQNSYSSGDLIVDTNPEEFEHYGCTPTNSCGSVDPINNYMSYSDDCCMNRFTREQSNRAVCSLVNYRPLLYGIEGETPAPGDFPWGAFLQIITRQRN